MTTQSTVWRSEVASELERAGYMKEAAEFRACRTPEALRGYRVCPTNPEHHAKAVSRWCKLRICPECGRAESARLVKQYLPHVLAAANGERRDFSLKHVILTTDTPVGHPDAWRIYRENWKNVDKVFDLLSVENWWQGGRGTIASAEFGEEGAKLHYHVVFYGEFIPQDEISWVWAMLTGCPVVWIRRVDNVGKAVKEICKYAAKLTVLEPPDVVKAFTIIKGSRRVRTRGIFYNLPPVTREHKVCKCCGSELELWSPQKLESYGSYQNVITAVGGTLLNLIIGNKSRNTHQQTENRQILAYEITR